MNTTMTMPKEGSPHDVLAGRAQYAIVCGDSHALCRELHLGCRVGDRKPFDLSLTSPPYEDRRTYGIGFNLKGEDWVRWACERFTAQYRATRGLTAWVVEGFTDDRMWSASPAMMMADLHRSGVRLRKPPIYMRRGIPGSGGNDWWANLYEFIVCASHGKLPWSDATAFGEPPKFPQGGAMSNRTREGQRINKSKGNRPDRKRPMPKLANPGNIIDCGAVGGGRMGSDLAHENEAPFPLMLAERFVRSFCPPGGIVFDGFSGSGTTLHAALLHGRRVIAVDVREDQCDVMRRRAAEAIAQLQRKDLAA